MKKIMSFVLALILIASLGIVAFATDTAGGTGEYSAEVKGSYVAGTTSPGTLFSVEIKWKNMEFTYHAAKVGEWDSEKHEYKPATDAKWEGEGEIVVINHSNAKITATPTYRAALGYGDATMTFNPAVLSIASAEGGSAQRGTMTVTPGGSLPQMENQETIGTITLTIAQDASMSAAELETATQTQIDKALALSVEISGSDELQEKVGSKAQELFQIRKNVNTVLQGYREGTKTLEDLQEAYTALLTCYNEVKSLVEA